MTTANVAGATFPDSYGVAVEYYFSEKSAGLLSARASVREIMIYFCARWLEPYLRSVLGLPARSK